MSGLANQPLSFNNLLTVLC